ncbi:hypothetical protein [Chitinophaga sp. HK235]|uniref:hypothetical protein n=1 Tax=Chitinophaga sp. HK235 TaxID=2952571 RepID=UPI001BAE28C9|nr:hypothetical protein [Chitinophaga sp. HK235]
MKNTFSGKLLACFFLSVFVLSSCKKHDDPVTPVYNLDTLYAHAVADAMITDSNKISKNLWPITESNPNLQWKTINGQTYVLMATFMRFPTSYPEGDSITNTWGESWLFIPKQMKTRIGQSFTPTSDTILRVSQLLGLPPVNPKSNTHIAEVWVKASNLFRPAGDPAINTTTAGPVLIPSAPADYVTWFNNYIIYAYYRPLVTSTDYHYPWTRMGYTYDWAFGANKVGLSEYVEKASSGMWVEKVRRAADYFR